MKSIILLSASAVALVTLFLSGCDKKTTDDLKRQANEAQKKIEVKAKEAKEVADQQMEQAKHAAKEAQPKVEEMAGKAKEATKDAIERTKEAADAASEKIKEAMSPTPTPSPTGE
jgi:FtsZ-interacting cell division protein ZipA